ncbi:conserved hypothetical protein [Streptomyces pristinaespiralis ATCC 25486]|uniref:Knr4/Smi1-like domain-containing protein n=3 Tax=Streptomyces pristinaespiralis TaxID=38300 RepID=D6X7K5_STRE2|nr:hypothetical protein SPRI_3023 [Streptomyces pristinaespiralis]EFH31123.1 conserved hypothetical protein [Streptomyces pristinaespiralis ATCC 25486]
MVAAMTHEFDLVRSLAAGAEDRHAAWDFVRGFAEHWTAAPLDTGGCPEAEVAAAEERLGLRLPPALREAYTLLGGREDLTSNHDTLRALAELYVDEAGEALVFRDENQGAARWGILLRDLALDDPPVLVRPDLADKNAERWEGWLERTSLAFLEIVLSEAAQAPTGPVDYLDAPDDEVLERLERDATRLPFPLYPAEDPCIRWFLYRDVLLRDDAGSWIHARGRTAEALDGIRDVLAGDWLEG